jgi:hypothetical protein
MIDQSKMAALIQFIKAQQASGKPELLLDPEMYFDGYEDEQCSICANSGDGISTARFFERLRAVGARPEVAGVFIRFCEYADAEEFGDSWIGSDSVYLLTTAALDDVQDWFADFEVSEVWEEKETAQFEGLPPVPEGFRLIAVWWD